VARRFIMRFILSFYFAWQAYPKYCSNKHFARSSVQLEANVLLQIVNEYLQYSCFGAEGSQMPGVSVFSKMRIGTKLGISAGLGVVLVGGMLVNQQIGNSVVERLIAGAQRQQGVAIEVVTTEVLLRRAQIAGRDLRNARTPDQVKTFRAELERVAATADARLATLEQNAQLPAARERFGKIRALFKDYAAALAEIGDQQAEILDLFETRNQIVSKWSRSVNIVVNSPELAFTPNGKDVEFDVYEAASAFKDARIAAWRYVALSEAAQIETISRSAEQTLKQLNYARDRTNVKSVLEGIDSLVTIVPQFTTILTATTSAIDVQNRIQAERAFPIEAETRILLSQASSAAQQTTDDAQAETLTELTGAGRIGLGAGLVVVCILLGSAVFASLTIGRPIRKIGEVLMELANGNKAVNIPYVERADEVGDTARAARTFKDNLLRMEQLEATQKEAEERAAEERRAAMHMLADEFEAVVGKIVEAVSSDAAGLESAAGTLTATAETTQQLSGIVASTSEEASANVHSVATSTEELAASINEIGRQVHESSQIAGDAVKQAEKTDARINQLSQAAQRIGDVVKLINAVAEQTNLLALNATIEAARAGEAGKGFAVVAQEVKALANQTAKATDEISAQISGMQAATRESVSAIKEIGETIDRVSAIASTIAAAVEQQGAAMQDIARNVQQAAEGTAHVAKNIAEVSRGAGETGSASAQVLASAQSLSTESNRLKSEVEKFLENVRAA
jgi:methyl-accepting chemotaxis protein